MTRWIGRWIVAVGVIHSVFAMAVFYEPLSGIVREGVWNAVDAFPGRPLAIWFAFFGLMTILFGLALDELEKCNQVLPASLAYGFAAITALAVVAMPASGGWLMIPPAVGMLFRKARSATD